jgi:hypothetical protein
MVKAIAIFALASFLNFFVFLVGTFILGGDAVSGASNCPPGNYIWDKRLPQPCHEVSPAVYAYSKLHTYSVFVSWPLAVAGLIYLDRGKLRRRGGTWRNAT